MNNNKPKTDKELLLASFAKAAASAKRYKFAGESDLVKAGRFLAVMDDHWLRAADLDARTELAAEVNKVVTHFAGKIPANVYNPYALLAFSAIALHPLDDLFALDTEHNGSKVFSFLLTAGAKRDSLASVFQPATIDALRTASSAIHQSLPNTVEGTARVNKISHMLDMQAALTEIDNRSNLRRTLSSLASRLTR